MDSWDLKKWRKKHGFNQVEAASKLGLNRGGLQNWEREVRPISKAVELACEEITRQLEQRQDFGPVILLYPEGEIVQHSSKTYCVNLLRSSCHPNSEAALAEVERLSSNPLFVNPLIIGQDGSVIWDSQELFNEFRRTRSEAS